MTATELTWSCLDCDEAVPPMCFEVADQVRLIKRRFCPCPGGKKREALTGEQADFIEWKRQAEVLLMQAGLSLGRYEKFRLNNWDSERQNGDALRVFDAVQSYIAAVAERSRNWLYLHGDYGLGKTHLAVATIRKIAADRLWRPHVIVWPELCGLTQESWGSRSGAEGAMWGQARAAKILLIDDLDKTITKQWAIGKLYSLINSRCDRRQPTIITANRSIPQLRKVWNAKEQEQHVRDTGGAVLSRIGGQLVKAVEFKGEDQRFVVAERPEATE